MSLESNLKYNGRLWIEINNVPVIGPGRVELLERIQECGSIRQAALQMNMSYRQAWQMIDHMNTHLGAPVLLSQRGGKGGGKAEVTKKGESIISEFKAFYKKFHHFLEGNTPFITL
jgi:molybdate transport system regulatory protein